MTDNEIIKALECCAQPISICKEWPCYDSNVPYPCTDQLKWAALNLIDSQKAEIERLKNKILEDDILLNDRVQEAVNVVSNADQKYIDALEEEINNKIAELKIAKSEAVKEFAERLKDNLQWDSGYDDKFTFENDIDVLVKEMVGDAE